MEHRKPEVTDHDSQLAGRSLESVSAMALVDDVTLVPQPYGLPPEWAITLVIMARPGTMLRGRLDLATDEPAVAARMVPGAAVQLQLIPIGE